MEAPYFSVYLLAPNRLDVIVALPLVLDVLHSNDTGVLGASTPVALELTCSHFVLEHLINFFQRPVLRFWN